MATRNRLLRNTALDQWSSPEPLDRILVLVHLILQPFHGGEAAADTATHQHKHGGGLASNRPIMRPHEMPQGELSCQKTT
jgi:hypothetical protein